ncbi:RNA polymerase Rpb1, domain 1-domain-containing protein [Scleroderma citrinum]
MERWKRTFVPAVEAQKELGIYLKAVREELNPWKVLDFFRRVSDEDYELLGRKSEFGRPEEYIWQYISVPPVCIRPSIVQDGASNEGDLTVKLTEIVFTNALIKQGLSKGAFTAQFMEHWVFLQLSRGFVQRLN